MIYIYKSNSLTQTSLLISVKSALELVPGLSERLTEILQRLNTSYLEVTPSSLTFGCSGGSQSVKINAPMTLEWHVTE